MKTWLKVMGRWIRLPYPLAFTLSRWSAMRIRYDIGVEIMMEPAGPDGFRVTRISGPEHFVKIAIESARTMGVPVKIVSEDGPDHYI